MNICLILLYYHCMEKQLVLSARAGNKKAFAQLMKAYYPRIFRAAYVFLRNNDDAADIVQDVFIRAMNSIEKFDPERPLYPWLYRITRNLCINKVSKKESKNSPLLEGDVYRSNLPGPEEIYDAKEQEAEIRRAVENLPEVHREIIILKYYQECSYEEMAEIMKIPKGTVMSRLYNARAKLKALLTEEEVQK